METNKANPYYPNINYRIEIKKDKYNKELLLPYKLLYNILKDEFLVLKKTLKDLFNKGVIYISNSSAVAPILFVRKPGGEL